MNNVSCETQTANHTKKAYVGLADAYEFFNNKLFAGILPSCLITLTRKKGMVGYFHGNRYTNGEITTDEIAFNPLYITKANVVSVLQTLVHEQCHLWQAHFGKPPRKAYHNKEWADKMELIGLMPSATGIPGGNRVGPRISHYTKPDGLFIQAVNEFIASYNLDLYQYIPTGKDQGKDKPNKNKAVFQCDMCGCKAWGKPDLKLVCGTCDFPMENIK